MSPHTCRQLLNPGAEAPDFSAQQAEAARYALIRRLWPALRHHLVRDLQPIGMIYGVVDHRLSAPLPDLPALHKDIDKINGLAKAALSQCMDVGTWLAPDPDALCPFSHGVADCVGLMAAGLNFRGFRLVNQVADAGEHVRRDALRIVLAAALLALTDAFTAPATLTLSASAQGGQVRLVLQAAPADEGDTQVYDDGYRKLLWRDVMAIAHAEEVGLSLRSEVMMRFTVEPSPPPH